MEIYIKIGRPKMSENKPVRRTLKYIQRYPTPRQIFNTIVTAPGYNYKTDKQFYQVRDQSLPALTYLIAGRISEVIRLARSQFELVDPGVLVSGIKLSKSTKAGKPRREQYRQEAILTLDGERAPLTKLVIKHLDQLGPKELLYNFGRVRAYQIISGITGEPCHYLRAYGENYLYDNWDQDLLAVADYLKVDPATLQHYIRRSYKKYKPA